MDENTWRFAQLMMWLIGLQTAILTSLMGVIWNNLNKKIEKLEDKIIKLDEKVTDIDKRVFAIETMLHMKDCCILKDDRQIKKAE